MEASDYRQDLRSFDSMMIDNKISDTIEDSNLKEKQTNTLDCPTELETIRGNYLTKDEWMLDEDIFLDDKKKVGRFLLYLTCLSIYIFTGPVVLLIIPLIESSPQAVFHNLHLIRLSLKSFLHSLSSLAFIFLWIYNFKNIEVITKFFFVFPIVFIYLVHTVSHVLFMSNAELRKVNLNTEVTNSKQILSLSKGKYTKMTDDMEIPGSEQHKRSLLRLHIENCMKLCIIDKRSFSLKIVWPSGVEDQKITKKQKISNIHKFLIKAEVKRTQGVNHCEYKASDVFHQIVSSEIFLKRRIISCKNLGNTLLGLMFALPTIGGLYYYAKIINSVIVKNPNSKLEKLTFITIASALLISVSIVRLMIFREIFFSLIEKMTIFKKISNLLNFKKPKSEKVNFVDRKSLNGYMNMLNLHFMFCKRDIQKIEVMLGTTILAVAFNLVIFYLDEYNIIILELNNLRLMYHLVLVFSDAGCFILFIDTCITLTIG